MDTSLIDIVNKLLSLKQEGGYWDFKQQWHASKSDLLHDIICLANNLENKDSYLILGVEDSTYRVTGVVGDPNRKNTQNLVDFLRIKKFAGGIRPIVFVETVKLGNKELDVIVVKNTNNTPYFLNESYEGVFANQIYTRVQDTNTPKTSSADINHIEYLWRKRFGIDKTPLEQFAIYIENKENWEEGDEYNVKYFYKYNPVFVISEILPNEQIRDLIIDELSDEAKLDNNWNKLDRENRREECYTATQISCDLPTWRELHFLYNQTKIYSVTSVSIDGGRCHMPAPFSNFAFLGDRRIDNTKENYQYHYFIKDTIAYKMIQFLSREYETDKYAFRTAMECIILFESDYERKQFDDFIINDVGLKEFRKVFKTQQSFATSRKAKDKQYADQTDKWLQIDHKSAKTLKHFFEKFKQSTTKL